MHIYITTVTWTNDGVGEGPHANPSAKMVLRSDGTKLFQNKSGALFLRNGGPDFFPEEKPRHGLTQLNGNGQSRAG